jgi:hypothetical protein
MSILLQEIKECIKNKRIFAFYYISSNEDVECIFMYPQLISLTNTILFGLDKTKKHKVTYLISNIRSFTDFTKDAWDKYSECEGCRYGLLNQMGHIGINGCIGNLEF